jgi:hypothetical protein
MNSDERKSLQRLINIYGIAGVLSELGAIYSATSVDLATVNAHLAVEWMHASVLLDQVIVEIE